MAGWREELLVWLMRRGNAWMRFYVVDQVAHCVMYNDAHNRTTSRHDPSWLLISRVWAEAKRHGDHTVLGRLTWFRHARQRMNPSVDFAWQWEEIPDPPLPDEIDWDAFWAPLVRPPVLLYGPDGEDVWIKRRGADRQLLRLNGSLCCLFLCLARQQLNRFVVTNPAAPVDASTRPRPIAMT
jgi:hypothetical protein